MIGSWVIFPLVLAALGLGWGALVQRAKGGESLGVYTVPVGIAAVIVVAGILTVLSATAPAAAPVAAAGGLIGLALSGRRRYLPAPAIRRGGRRAADLRRAGDPQRAGDVPGLRAP